jgi:hypothetical protein
MLEVQVLVDVDVGRGGLQHVQHVKQLLAFVKSGLFA